ncbi:GNAT family N-acetyltransferase [Oxalobacteraceae bacterium]|nr:GNAT family N-acetyltransferase [Oxalobacteraceae bacterium]
MIIATLRQQDLLPLLAFELENRAWFEQSVEARAPDFYTADGVAAHIADYLAALRAGTMHPCLLLDEHGAILGRSNLRDINADRHSAEIGYRLGQRHTGQGLATIALDKMKQLARQQWQLEELNAYITMQNIASSRVVLKSGFVLQDTAPIPASIAGEMRDSFHYRCLLNPEPAL